MQKVVLGFSNGFGTKRSLLGVTTDVMTVGFLTSIFYNNDRLSEHKENFRYHLVQTLTLIHIRKGKPREFAICPKSHTVSGRAVTDTGVCWPRGMSGSTLAADGFSMGPEYLLLGLCRVSAVIPRPRY